MARIADFEQLMADVAAGSEDAIWELAETYTPYILRAARKALPSQLRPKIDSQDFAQTLWASILLKRTDLTRLKNPAELIAYLARATHNKVIDKTRHYSAQKCDVGREEDLEGHMPGPSDSQQIVHDRGLFAPHPTPSTLAGLRERWNRALADASERDRRILQLRLQGATFDDISAQLRIDNATARRAIQRLIGQLAESP
jgi:RNA polymerase sigma factor (sigma-70 family)